MIWGLRAVFTLGLKSQIMFLPVGFCMYVLISRTRCGDFFMEASPSVFAPAGWLDRGKGVASYISTRAVF